jgi:mRNA-degrading endonuclease toxin of MazEF toxin-antitoxin module
MQGMFSFFEGQMRGNVAGGEKINCVTVRLRVNRIESCRDIMGNLGKRIELVEDQEMPKALRAVDTDEARVVNSILLQVQRHFGPVVTEERSNPKLWLFLTEEEYEALGIVFDVNQTYNVAFQPQTIKFSKAEQT